MSECVHCGAVDEPEDGVVVGLLGDRNENICTVCRADDLNNTTVLSRREAEVAAHKQLTGASHAAIANRLSLDKSTVDEYSRRLKEKIWKARSTYDEVGELVE